MKKLTYIILFLPFFCFTQSDTSYAITNNDITSINENGINKLVSKYEKILKNTGGINGWRLQLKFQAKEVEIIKIKLKFIKLFPEIPVYLEYEEPYYRIRVGNCRTKLDALKIKNIIQKYFPDTYPVPEIINISQIN